MKVSSKDSGRSLEVEFDPSNAEDAAVLAGLDASIVNPDHLIKMLLLIRALFDRGSTAGRSQHLFRPRISTCGIQRWCCVVLLWRFQSHSIHEWASQTSLWCER